MWHVPQLGVDTSHKIFVSVKNASAVKMTVGHGVFWNYTITAGGYVTQGGYEVTFSPVASTNCCNPALLCGIVGRDSINVGEYGLVQKFGEHPKVAISGGASAAPYTSLVASVTSWTASKITNLILKPCLGAFAAANSGAVANYGYFGYMACLSQVTTQVQTTASDVGYAWPGGYAIPLDNVALGATATYTSGTTVKAFIHCLD